METIFKTPQFQKFNILKFKLKIIEEKKLGSFFSLGQFHKSKYKN